MSMTIPELMRSISEVLTTAEEMLHDDEPHDVGPMLASYLKTLLVELDKMLTATNPPPPRAATVTPKSNRSHMDCLPNKCLHGSADCPFHGNAITRKVAKTKRPVVNRYPNSCVRCNRALTAGQGYVLPNVDKNAKKKWFAFCDDHYNREIASL